MSEKLFQKYYVRIAKESWLKAVLCGLIVGFSSLLVCSAIFWLIGFKYPWVSFIVLGVVIAAATPLFYFKKFRPTIKQIAKRVDELGLEERLLTMHELENDDSYIAMRQREDAKAALATVNAGLVKIKVAISSIVALCLVVPTAAATTTASVLASTGKIASGSEIIQEQLKNPTYYEIQFEEDGGGMIEGEIFQLVEEGKPIAEVTAVPDDNYYFIAWVWEIDGEERTLEGTDVFFVAGMVADRPLTITACFAEIGEPSDESGDVDQEPKDDDGEEDDRPKDDSDSKDQVIPPMDDDDGEKDPGDDKKPPSQTENSDRTDGKNQIKDGETYYGDEYDGAVEDTLEDMEQSEEIPEDVKDIIKDYYDNIKK